MINQHILDLAKELETSIQEAYQEQVTIPQAEALASKFLYAQLLIADELRSIDLDARMKKTGLKAVKAAVYLEKCQTSEKKPSDVMLEQVVNLSEVVTMQQEQLDNAEVNKDLLERYLSIFKEAHIHFRNISKGKFE